MKKSSTIPPVFEPFDLKLIPEKFEEGTRFLETGHLGDAVLIYEHILKLDPTQIPATVNLAVAFSELGHFDKACKLLDSLLKNQPDNARAWISLGNLFFKQGELTKAQNAYFKAHENDGAMVEPLTNLGAIAHQRGSLDEAIGWFAKSLKLNPRQPHLYRHVGLMFQEKGDFDSARRSYHQAITQSPDKWLWRLQRDLLCPALMTSREEITAWWQQAGEALTKLSGEVHSSVTAQELFDSNAYPPFFTAYHEQPLRSFREAYADLIRRSLPSLDPAPIGSGPSRIGFVVTRSHETIFLTLMSGMLRRFSPDLKLVVFCHPSGVTKLREGIGRDDISYVPMPPHVDSLIGEIRRQSCDVLYFWEIGTDSINYFLPFFKLARVQCSSWGFPVTSGMSEVADFLSAADLSQDEQASDYSESLIRLAGLPCYYSRPSTTGLKSRDDLGLPSGKHLYLCPQNLFKLHPDFDSLVSDILSRDPMGVLVLLAGAVPWVQEALVQRFSKTIPDSQGRILFVPRLSRPDYLSLLAAGDVMLDSIWYGGGATSAEGLGMGTPVVTWPSKYLSGQMTLAFYKRLGMPELVADSADSYVRKAVEMACEPDQRLELVTKIRERDSVLFEDQTSVKALENYFRLAAERARQ